MIITYDGMYWGINVTIGALINNMLNDIRFTVEDIIDHDLS